MVTGTNKLPTIFALLGGKVTALRLKISAHMSRWDDSLPLWSDLCVFNNRAELMDNGGHRTLTIPAVLNEVSVDTISDSEVVEGSCCDASFKELLKKGRISAEVWPTEVCSDDDISLDEDEDIELEAIVKPVCERQRKIGYLEFSPKRPRDCSPDADSSLATQATKKQRTSKSNPGGDGDEDCPTYIKGDACLARVEVVARSIIDLIRSTAKAKQYDFLKQLKNVGVRLPNSTTLEKLGIPLCEMRRVNIKMTEEQMSRFEPQQQVLSIESSDNENSDPIDSDPRDADHLLQNNDKREQNSPEDCNEGLLERNQLQSEPNNNQHEGSTEENGPHSSSPGTNPTAALNDDQHSSERNEENGAAQEGARKSASSQIFDSICTERSERSAVENGPAQNSPSKRLTAATIKDRHVAKANGSDEAQGDSLPIEDAVTQQQEVSEKNGLSESRSSPTDEAAQADPGMSTLGSHFDGVETEQRERNAEEKEAAHNISRSYLTAAFTLNRRIANANDGVGAIQADPRRSASSPTVQGFDTGECEKSAEGNRSIQGSHSTRSTAPAMGRGQRAARAYGDGGGDQAGRRRSTLGQRIESIEARIFGKSSQVLSVSHLPSHMQRLEREIGIENVPSALVRRVNNLENALSIDNPGGISQRVAELERQVFEEGRDSASISLLARVVSVEEELGGDSEGRKLHERIGELENLLL